MNFVLSRGSLPSRRSRLPPPTPLPPRPRRNFSIRADADSKLHIPSDSFGGISPERKAATQMATLITFCSAKAVLSQLEGSGRGAVASFNAEQYDAIYSTLMDTPLREADAWLKVLASRNKLAAVRVMEVRSLYGSSDFEWENVRKLTLESIERENLQLMRSSMGSLLVTQEHEASGDV